MRKKLALVAMGAAAALTLAGCAQGDSDSASTDTSSEAPTGDIRVWLVGDDTPDNAREYLKETFEENHPGSTLTIEQQEWGGLVDKYTTALSGSDAPDVVEVGNTQASAFTSAGAFLDLTDKYDDLGGDDLNQGFVQSGTYDGKFYAAPYYAGSRIVFYNSDVVGDDEVPETLEDYVNKGIELRKEKGDDFSGIYAAGKDWYNALPFVWEYGGYIAEQQDDGSWKAGFSDGVEGLKLRQKAFEEASAVPADADETNSQVAFCDEEAGYVSAPSWWSVYVTGDGGDIEGCPDLEENLHVFAMPGKDGGAAHAFAGGSNIAVAAKSAHPELAYDALKILVSPEYQKILAEAGMIPGLTTASDSLPDDEVTQAAAAAANNALLTPAAPKWAEVEDSGVIKQALVEIAQGGDVEAIAKKLDGQVEDILNG